MKRVPRDSSSISDPSKVVPHMLPGGCWGEMFDPTTPECNLCKDTISCAIGVSYNVIPDGIARIKNEKGSFLDEYEFQYLKDKKLSEIFDPETYENDERYSSLIDLITKLSNCDNKELVQDHIQCFFLENNLIVKDDIICLNQ